MIERLHAWHVLSTNLYATLCADNTYLSEGNVRSMYCADNVCLSEVTVMSMYMC